MHLKFDKKKALRFNHNVVAVVSHQLKVSVNPSTMPSKKEKSGPPPPDSDYWFAFCVISII